MMKFILMMLFYFFIMNMMDLVYMQLMYLIMLMILIFSMMIFYPLNNMLNIKIWIYYFFMMDVYSWGLILLSIMIMTLMIFSNSISKNNYFLYFMNLMNLMLILLIMCFISMNLMLFYIYFESSLIPIFLLILGWGYQVERIQAGMYMMLYTLLGSMPLFLVINFLYLKEFSMMMDLVKIKLNLFLIYISLMLAFLIKMPLYIVHLWLPKAHVEAPLVGSMILAGVMLKLGSYGVFRVILMMELMCKNFSSKIIIFSLIGSVISSMICFMQVDMKMLVAYSSVVHMGGLMAGLLTMFNWGYVGGYLMMIAHGLCSSGLFCLVNVNYKRLNSRSLIINKGMMNIHPVLTLMWFLLCSSNLSFPPSLNLLSEIMLFNALVAWSKLTVFLLGSTFFLGAFYSLYLYSYGQHGKMNNLIFSMKSVTVSEIMLLMMHWIPLNLMFLLIHLF
uniref:NADH-ubiquinone oxidoreductase chain 4 n=1 Tax=Hypsicera sp. ZJUH_2016019 TaxID=2491161 RepID=A0A3S8V0V3_9HYME|nr:NADH dehydrogenase subunit 4 [Hypsicera sp. ZJUH_2016019]